MSTLFVVATPIGNLSDLTLRAVETLKSVDAIASEDTRRTEGLLRHLGIAKPLFRYDEHTHGAAANRILSFLRVGKAVAVVTDAGTPAISDPGSRLVAAVVAAGFKVVPIPGPSAVTAALSASGFSADGFVFLGFLPRKPGPARRVLQEALRLGRTVVLFESPFRGAKTLSLIAEWAPDAPVVMARELTKIHEEFVRGDVRSVLRSIEGRPLKGEIVIVIGPTSEPGGEKDEANADTQSDPF